MPAVPVVAPIGPGIVPTTLYNQLVAAMAFTLASPTAELRQTSSQTLTTSTWTALQFQAEEWDLDVDGIGGHDNVTNNTRYTARYPGRYLIASGYAPATSATGARGVRFAVNGIVVNASQILLPSVALGGFPSRTKQVYLTDGDYVEAQAFQSSGGNLGTSVVSANEQSHFTIRWLGN